MKKIQTFFTTPVFTVLCLFFVTVLRAQDFEEGPSSSPPSRRGQQQQRQQPMGSPPQMGGGGGVAISVSDGAVFVVSQGQLFKYDEKTLKLQAKTSLQAKKGDDFFQGGRPPPGQGGGSSSSDDPSPFSFDELGRGFDQGGRSGGGGGSEGPPMGGPRMMMRQEGTAIGVSDDFVYVVSQGRLYKYGKKNLELQNSVELERRESEKRPGQAKPRKTAD